MLQLKSITKDYSSGENSVHALRGVDLNFRKSEFVSILGPSGCGKTTLLNIIGGLDKYTSGDLFINGKSTKDFKDRDWDSYRNHSVGFVFQSYNLIPHQNVLKNVELALTLSGVPRAERRHRAVEALKRVGLENQLNKKPAEMSGGQMQRVAIARAIVNNPDIILADEPTGALDTETSIQVMEILKEISKDRLVIMVTHNPELAEKYSTRTIRMLDGVITDDSKPLEAEEPEKFASKTEVDTKAHKKPSMSLLTSFGLSLNNLFTKKGRTILTSFAGSIGIIGIALIFAVSQGMTTYINTLQEDTLSSYPITLEAQHMDMGSILETFMGKAESSGEHDKDAVYQKVMLYELINALNTTEADQNDLKAFKEYLEKEMEQNEKLREAVNGVQYSYDFDMIVYTKSADGKIVVSDTAELLSELLIENFGMDLSSIMNMSEQYGISSSPIMGMGSLGNTTLWQEMLPANDGGLINPLLKKQYDVIEGDWPKAYNEIVLVVDENNEIEDMTLYALGLKSKEEMNAVAKAAFGEGEINTEQKKWSYEEIMNMEFRSVLGSDCYTLDPATQKYVDLRESEAGLKYLYNNGITLKVSGIIRPNEDSVSTMLSGAIGYTKALTEYIIENSKDTDIVRAQLENPNTDIFTGLPFKENTGNLSDEQKAEEFKKYVASLNTENKAKAYEKIMSIPPEDFLPGAVEKALAGVTQEQMRQTLSTALSSQMSMSEEKVAGYLDNLSDEELAEMYTSAVTEQIKATYRTEALARFTGSDRSVLALALDNAVGSYTVKQCAVYYDEVLEFSESSYEDNLVSLGYVEIDTPSSINIYASSFENKDIIEEAISDYNKNVKELEKITYTDYVGIMMSSITSIINAISYVLIAFVAVSLIVSSIMIGVITLISVQERTKEIGILRAIGASKKNVSSMFNAETVIIGFASGLIGVGITYLLCIPINIILNTLTGISNLRAILPPSVALVLIAISVILTLFAGIIPSRSAAKKDPVVALRTE